MVRWATKVTEAILAAKVNLVLAEITRNAEIAETKAKMSAENAQRQKEIVLPVTNLAKHYTQIQEVEESQKLNYAK